MSHSLRQDAAQTQAERAELCALLKNVPVEEAYRQDAQYTQHAQTQAKRAELCALLKNVPEEEAYRQDAQFTQHGPCAVIISCVIILFLCFLLVP